MYLTDSSEINVAYADTFGDLSANGAGFGDYTFGDDVDFSTDFTAINTGMSNGMTVSPKDVFNGDQSVPPSTSFTNLTTPGSTLLETPDSYQASPLFQDNLNDSFGYGGNSNFFPPLPGDESYDVPMARTTSSSSANQVVVHPGGPSMGHRKRSSTTASPALATVRPSSVAGVNARKRDKPLPPIMVDENDAVALKRARNTAAARKSRAKKMEERDGLEGKVAELEAMIAKRDADLAQLAGERDFWRAKAQATDDE